jgi:uncharacterized membrane protein
MSLHSAAKSLFLFARTHPLRGACTRIARSRWFQRVALAFVFLSCVLLAVEDPHTLTREETYAWLERVSLGFFVLEALIEIIDMTFVAYVRHWSHVMDLAVIVNTLVAMFVDANAGVQVCLLDTLSDKPAIVRSRSAFFDLNSATLL